MANHSDIGFVPDPIAATSTHADLGFTPDSPKAATSVPGMEKLGAMPGPAKPPTVQAQSSLNPINWGVSDLQDRTPQEMAQPSRRNPRTGQQYTVKDELTRLPLIDDPTEGIRQMSAGTAQMAQPQMEQKAGGLSKVIRGGFQAATPLAAPVMAAAPARAALAIGTGMAAQQGVEHGLKSAGTPEGYANLAGDVAGLFSGSRLAKSPTAPETFARGVKTAGKLAVDLPTEILGKTTGNGTGESLRIAANRGFNHTAETPATPYLDASRGKISELQLVDNAKEVLGRKHAQDSADWQNSMKEITDRNPNATIDPTPIQNALQSELAHRNVRVNTGEDGKPSLDFSNSHLAADPAGQTDVALAHKVITNWTDNSPQGIHNLKVALDSLYTPSSQARALTQGLKATTRNVLNENVPGYQEMTQKYGISKNLLDQIETDLSLGKNTKNAGTAIRKLATALGQNNEYRKSLLESATQLDPKADILGQIAGYANSKLLPRGITGAMEGASLPFAAAMGHPGVLAAAPFASPKLMGKAAFNVGRGSGIVSRAAGRIRDGLADATGETAPWNAEQSPVQTPIVHPPPPGMRPSGMSDDALVRQYSIETNPAKLDSLTNKLKLRGISIPEKPSAESPAARSASALSQAPDYAGLFDQAEKLEARRAQRPPTVPSFGSPVNVSETMAKRDQISIKVLQKPFTELSNSERNAIDELISEGYTGAPSKTSRPPVWKQ